MSLLGRNAPSQILCEIPRGRYYRRAVGEGSTTMAERYLEQYERMRRSYDRFREIKPGLTKKISSDYEDDIYAFFMQCYHLKDWIKNDTSVKTRTPDIGTDVEQFVNGSEALSLCADICNSLNHLELKRSSKRRTPELRAKAISFSIEHWCRTVNSTGMAGTAKQ